MTTEQDKKAEEQELFSPDVTQETIDLAARTLLGDLRTSFLALVKQQKKPFKDLDEAQQRSFMNSLDQACREIIYQAVEIIAAGGRVVVKGSLDQVTIKDGIKAVIQVSKYDEHRHELNDSVGSIICIAIAGANRYLGQRSEAEAEVVRDQTDLLDGPVDQVEDLAEQVAEQQALGVPVDPATGEILERDPKFWDAMREIRETQIVSGRALSRSLSIGQTRAAAIIDQLATAGLVTAQDEKGKRFMTDAGLSVEIPAPGAPGAARDGSDQSDDGEGSDGSGDDRTGDDDDVDQGDGTDRHTEELSEADA